MTFNTSINYWFGDDEIELDITFTVDTRGIGTFDYGGLLAYDSSDYPEIDIIESKHVEFNKALSVDYDRIERDIMKHHEDKLTEYAKNNK